MNEYRKRARRPAVDLQNGVVGLQTREVGRTADEDVRDDQLAKRIAPDRHQREIRIRFRVDGDAVLQERRPLPACVSTNPATSGRRAARDRGCPPRSIVMLSR